MNKYIYARMQETQAGNTSSIPLGRFSLYYLSPTTYQLSPSVHLYNIFIKKYCPSCLELQLTSIYYQINKNRLLQSVSQHHRLILFSFFFQFGWPRRSGSINSRAQIIPLNRKDHVSRMNNKKK